jgi:hypothetical protein
VADFQLGMDMHNFYFREPGCFNAAWLISPKIDMDVHTKEMTLERRSII